MIRKTLTILSLIGLLLSVGAWGLSYLKIGHQGNRHIIAVYEGRISYYHSPHESSVNEWFCPGFRSFRTRWWISYDEYSGAWWSVGIPLWMPSALFAIFLMLCFLPIGRRRKRKKLGLCLKCGYDLRGLTEPRCPECGTSLEKS